MLLAVNVGNTNTHFGIFQGKRLLQAFNLPTPSVTLQAAWKQRLQLVLRPWEKRGKWEGVMAATVVPQVKPELHQLLSALTKCNIIWVTSVTPMPVKNAYRPPKSLGVDRLLNAVAAREEFGAPVIIVDAGTAFHIDVVDSRGVFLGGAIWPGLAMSAACLARGTALLPRVNLRKPASCLGRSTRQGLQAGIAEGTLGAVDRLVASLRQLVGKQAPVIGTGGGFKPGGLDLPGRRCLRPHLALLGLNYLWQARLK
jgi:type III pantothenate kinase